MPMPDWLRLLRSEGVPAEDAALWAKCPSCGEMLYRKDLEANLSVCTKCNYHFRMRAYDRINALIDADFVEIGNDILPGDPLEWTDKRPYAAKLEADREKSNLSEAIVTGFGTLEGFPVALGVMDFNFRGGTMARSSANASRICSKKHDAASCRASSSRPAAEHAWKRGMLALMQMAKTTLAVERFMSDGNPFITVLTDPTTGGVSASFAFESDIIIAEARASIGFAGRRVIEQTIRQKLPENFQTAEFLLEKGHVDLVVPRVDMRGTLIRLLDYAVDRKRISPVLKAVPSSHFERHRRARKGPAARARDAHPHVAGTWQRRVRRRRLARREVSRAPRRSLREPHTVGARPHGAPSEAAARGRLHRGLRCVRRTARRPSFSRRSRARRRLAKFADGASSCSRSRRAAIPKKISSQLRDGVARRLSQGEASDGTRLALSIADREPRRYVGRRSRYRLRRTRAVRSDRSCLTTLAKATVPVVATIIGEGGSGGALALALADTVIMAENAVYSVASPEGCAAILWGDSARAPEAAERLKLTSNDLLGFGIVDRIVKSRSAARIAMRPASFPSYSIRSKTSCARSKPRLPIRCATRVMRSSGGSELGNANSNRTW